VKAEMQARFRALAGARVALAVASPIPAIRGIRAAQAILVTRVPAVTAETS
jgi:hypothetical protein